jgi:RNA polymerase sigma-70 factor, ECF subfamily
MNHQQELEVVQGLREGNADAWRTLYNAYCRQIWQSVARLIGPNAADVADVVQETFIAAARSAHKYDAARGPLWQWLYGIARNHVALHFRKRRYDHLRPPDEIGTKGSPEILRWLEDHKEQPDDVLYSAELASMVRVVLADLPVDYESVLTAKYIDGASLEQIAGSEKSSVAAVNSRLARARQAFRQVFLKTFRNTDTGQMRGSYES